MLMGAKRGRENRRRAGSRADAIRAGAARPGVPMLVHNQTHALLIFTGNDLKFQDHRQAPLTLLQRVSGGQAHGCRLPLEKHERGPVTPGRAWQSAVTGMIPSIS